MTKVGRAFTLDQRISERLDEVTHVPGRSKPMNKSRYVNDALDWYMNRNFEDILEAMKEERRFYQNKLEKKRLAIGGLEDDLASLRAVKACPSLWCRWKRLLLRSREEQQEQ